MSCDSFCVVWTYRSRPGCGRGPCGRREDAPGSLLLHRAVERYAEELRRGRLRQARVRAARSLRPHAAVGVGDHLPEKVDEAIDMRIKGELVPLPPHVLAQLSHPGLMVQLLG